MRRGEIWWSSLSPPKGSSPGYRRPVVVIQADEFNESRIQTVIVAAITSNLRLVEAPGNFSVSSRGTGLPKKSVVNVSQLLTVNKMLLTERIGRLDGQPLLSLDDGLKLVLGL